MANDNSAKMQSLLEVIKRQKNGETVELMARHGLHYPVNYGVSTPAIRLIALDYAPDYQFARFLYGKGIREMQIASFVIADPAMLVADELEFWADGLVNTELAETFGSWLLWRSPALEYAADQWLNSKTISKYRQYAVILALCKAFDKGISPLSTERLKAIALRFADSDESILRRAADNLDVRL